MNIMDGYPKSLEDCIKRDTFEVQNKFNEDKFQHIERKLQRLHDEAISDVTNLRKDLLKDYGILKEEIQKEINYKNKSNRDFIIYVTGGMGALMGTVWTKITFVEQKLHEHTSLLWHEGAGEILDLLSINMDKVICKVFGFC